MLNHNNTNTNNTNTNNTKKRGKRPMYNPGDVVRALIPQRRSMLFTGKVIAHGRIHIDEDGNIVPNENISESFYAVEVVKSPDEQYNGRRFLLATPRILGLEDDLAIKEKEEQEFCSNVENKLKGLGRSLKRDLRSKNPSWILEEPLDSDSLREIADLLDNAGLSDFKFRVSIQSGSIRKVDNTSISDVFGSELSDVA